MRVIAPVLLVLLLLLPLWPAHGNPVLTINLHGDTVEYAGEEGAVAVRGNVTITVQSDQPGIPTASLATEQLEGNLRSGHLIASQGVRLRSQQFALRGERADMNFQTDEFVLDKGAMSVEVESQIYPGRILRGFFFGNELGRKNNVIYVIEGRLTTCDRARPHYAIGTRKLSYDTRTRELTIEDGRLQLFGVTLRLPGRYKTKFGGDGPGGGLPIPMPGYSSYNGLYLPLRYSFSDPEADWQLLGELRVGTALRLPGVLTLAKVDEEADEVFRAVLSRREEVNWDIERRSRISRLPEISYLRGWNETNAGIPRLNAGLFAGIIHERADKLPRTSATRAGATLSYSGTPWQRRDRRGFWWATELDQTFYSTGDRLRDIRLEAGVGGRLGGNTLASIWGVHHITSGASPFLFDDVWVEDEVQGLLSTQLTERWGVDLYGRYDADESELRDYTVKLSRRSHCLTWSLQYSKSSETIGIGLDVNGITGRTPPPETRPLVAPEEVPPLPEMVPADDGVLKLPLAP